ncbi:MBL fold metallo-hydrolase [Mucisphaera sp.]|uniref:MBL fold metallo-hydrolase n=1 Tax=Mucisphaera sp. TaxID=2913024 RepID=UPI003D125978
MGFGTEQDNVVEPIKHLRVRVYGTQGSCSVFPSLAERRAWQDVSDARLLEAVFRDLAEREATGEPVTVEALLGGEVTRERLLAYRAGFGLRSPRVYDGWTTCIHAETADGHDLVFDAGSGFRNCARDLQSKWGDRGERELHLFGSHSHNDHTAGFDQAPVCFDARNTLRIYGNRQFLHALDSYLGIFSRRATTSLYGVQTPISYSVMPATFLAAEITGLEAGSEVEADLAEDELPRTARYTVGEPIEIGETRVTAFELYHPAPCLGYRVEHGTKVFVFCTDHELRHGSDPGDVRQVRSLAAEERLMDQADGADLLYRDGQYLRSDYDGVSAIGSSSAVPRMDWGHSCVEDVQEMAVRCGVARTLIGHHDPNRGWAERNRIDEGLLRWCANRPERVQLARAEMTIQL